jgi:RNA polymerase sigma-70 factor, ECF subfamily
MNLEQFKIEILPLRSKLMGQALKFMSDRSDAEDVVQEAFLKLWSLRDSIDQYNNKEAFSVTIVKNLCNDHWRSCKRRANLDTDVMDELQIDMVSSIEQRDTVRLIKLIIEHLPPLQQTIIRMKDVEGYEMSEIAAITGCEVENVRCSLSRARKKVRDSYMNLMKINRDNKI